MRTAEHPTANIATSSNGVAAEAPVLPDRPAGAGRWPPLRIKRPFFQRPGVILAGLVLAIAGILFAAVILLHALTHESTDDAFIDGNVVSIAPRIAGKVLAVYVKDNQAVKKGDPLFELDPSDYEAVLVQRKAALQVAITKEASADASVRQAEAHVKTIDLTVDAAKASADGALAAAKLAQSNFRRSKQLSGGGAISVQDYEQSLTNSVSADSTLQTKVKEVEAGIAYASEARTMADSAVSEAAGARAGVDEAKAAVSLAELQLSYTQPVAPADGFVTSKAVEAGDYVQVGQTLLAIVPREVWVTANYKETQLTNMRPGEPATIEVDAYPGRKLRGYVNSIQAGSGARFSLLPPENATGNFVKVVQRVPIKIVFDEKLDPQHVLGPGMSAVPDVTVRGSAGPALFVAVLAVVLILILSWAALAWMRKSRRE